MPARYSDTNKAAAFGLLINAMSGGRDQGSIFPRSDAEDMSRGARFIPGEVTLARRDGQTVDFVTTCGLNCWYWLMPNGLRIYHYDSFVYEQIARHNNGDGWTRDSRMPAGPCPNCGNPFTRGGTVTSEDVANGAYKEQAT